MLEEDYKDPFEPRVPVVTVQTELPVTDETMDPTPVARKGRKPGTKSTSKAAVVVQTGLIYLLLQSNGKYKELRESELQTEASGVFKDPTLRLVKAQFLIPELSFKTAEE
jgi:hypothetical protein